MMKKYFRRLSLSQPAAPSAEDVVEDIKRLLAYRDFDNQTPLRVHSATVYLVLLCELFYTTLSFFIQDTALLCVIAEDIMELDVAYDATRFTTLNPLSKSLDHLHTSLEYYHATYPGLPITQAFIDHVIELASYLQFEVEPQPCPSSYLRVLHTHAKVPFKALCPTTPSSSLIPDAMLEHVYKVDIERDRDLDFSL